MSGTIIMGYKGNYLQVDPNGNIGARPAGCPVEIASAQHTKAAATTTTFTLADDATEIGVYVESGNIRVRTDGSAATTTTGIPIGEGFYEYWQAASISVYCVEASVVTVVSR